MHRRTGIRCALLLAGALAAPAGSAVTAQDAAPATSGRGGGAARPTTEAWILRPTTFPPYVAPNKPHWKLTDILASHTGRASWAEAVLKDDHFFAQYISMGPGERAPRQLETDTRIWFVVQRGQVRFNIQGVEPFVATARYIVQIPMRTPFSMETVGAEPSLRLEVRLAGDAAAYPIADNPTPPQAPPGYTYVKARIGGNPASYTDDLKPYIDYNTVVVKNQALSGVFLRDGRGFAAIVRGTSVPVPPATQLGHFHLGLGEWWLIIENDVNFQIEGVPELIQAHEGDVVYAPRGRHHRATIGGPAGAMGARLAMGGTTDAGVSGTLLEEGR